MIIRETEAEFRKWFKRCWHGDVKWLEPSLGSTTGVPDAEVVGKEGLPVGVELKLWSTRQRLGFPIAKDKSPLVNMYMRPAQVRYHVLANREGKRTVVIGLVKHRQTQNAFWRFCEGSQLPFEDSQVYRDHDWFDTDACRAALKELI